MIISEFIYSGTFDTMLEIFPNLGAKYIIDSDQKNLLPFLNMGEGSSSAALQNRFLKKSE